MRREQQKSTRYKIQLAAALVEVTGELGIAQIGNGNAAAGDVESAYLTNHRKDTQQ